MTWFSVQAVTESLPSSLFLIHFSGNSSRLAGIMMNQETASPHRVRMRYRVPELVVYGTLADLTKSANSDTDDGVVGSAASRPNPIEKSTRGL
jgi:hypothetical protein